MTVTAEPDDHRTFGTPMLRALLVALLQGRNQFTTTARIADHLWQKPPVSMAANLRTHAAKLRTALEARQTGLGQRLHTRRGGTGGTAYQLIVRPDELDVEVSARLAEQGHQAASAGDPAAAVEAFRAALAYWRGPVGDDLPDTAVLRAHADMLNEKRLRLREELLAARLALGDRAGVISELRELAEAAPLRERVCELLMQGLYEAGDAAGALAAYDTHRRAIASVLGALPTPRIQAFHLAILRHDDIVPGGKVRWIEEHRVGAGRRPARQPQVSYS